MTRPTPRVEIDVAGTMVGFLRRDIRQISDREMALVERLVLDQQRETAVGSRVTRIVIETDYLDRDRISYTASYHVRVDGRDEHAGAGEGDGGVDAC